MDTTELDEVIELGAKWLSSLPPCDENKLLLTNASKQLTEQACQFGMSVSDAIKRDHPIAAYGNSRLVVDRLLHAAHFLWLEDEIEWMYWSMAEHSRLVSSSLSLKLAEPADQEDLRELLKSIRHWNRTEDDRDSQMKKPSSFKWASTKRNLLTGIEGHVSQVYDIFSTYVHPTYRGHNPLSPGLEYVLNRTVAFLGNL